MAIRRAALRPFRLRLRRPLVSAHGSIEGRAGFLVSLEDDEGFVGLGEATPLPEFGTESLSACEAALTEACTTLLRAGEAGAETEIEEVLDLVGARQAPCAQAALECAIDDLAARRAGQSLAEFWRARARRAGFAVPSEELSTPLRVPVQALVGGQTPEEVTEAVQRARREGFSAFKLKLASQGDAGWPLDFARVKALREAAGEAARLRLDANEGWSRAGAREALEALAPLSIDFVEQPLVRDDVEGLIALFRDAPVAIAADESLLGGGLKKVVKTPLAQFWVVKPAAVGGFRAALRVALAAQTQSIEVIWSSLLDGSISRLASAQWAAAVSDSGKAQGLGTGPLLREDFQDGVRLEQGCLVFEKRLGLGIDPEPLLTEENVLMQGPARFFSEAL